MPLSSHGSNGGLQRHANYRRSIIRLVSNPILNASCLTHRVEGLDGLIPRIATELSKPLIEARWREECPSPLEAISFYHAFMVCA